MATDPVRVRVLAVPGAGSESEHLEARCVCTQWAAEWKDHLLRGLPASSRGRLDLDLEMAHHVAELSAEEVLAKAGEIAVAVGESAHRVAGENGGRESDDEWSAVLAARPSARTNARDMLAAQVEEFGPDIVLAYGGGTVAAYEALSVATRRVPLFVSLSSPLAVPSVFASLSPAPTHARGVWPGAAEHWIDIYDRRDPAATRRPLIDHFAGPVADRPIDLTAGRGGPAGYLSCPTLGVLVEDHFARWRPDRALPADLRAVLTDLCPDEVAINALLDDIGFPIARLPAFVSADARWGDVMHELVCGALVNGVDRLIERALRRYPGNADLGRLRRECNRPGWLRS